jgi:ABC-type nitrate/sulfonate/bicarbonate transport system substrate-binding protein
MTRARSPLAAGALLIASLALVGAAWTASPSARPTRVAAGNQTVRIALDYSANVNYLGIYVAIDKGFFARQGISAKIIPYANTPAETLVESGNTDLGISYPPDVIINRAKGLEYKAVAALVEQNTTALAVLASSPYRRPAQLDGKLYGGFGIASDPPIVTAILKGDGVAKPSFRQVVLNTDVIDALSKNRIQYTAVFGGIDDVTAALQGVKLRTFPYRKYLGAAGDYPNAVFVASDSTIARRADALRRALGALAQGYEFAARHPAAAEAILIRDNETALGKSAQIVVATGNATARTFVNGAGHWGPLSTQDFAGLEKILAKGGVVKGPLPAPRDLFTNALLPTS